MPGRTCLTGKHSSATPALSGHTVVQNLSYQPMLLLITLWCCTLCPHWASLLKWTNVFGSPSCRERAWKVSPWCWLLIGSALQHCWGPDGGAGGAQVNYYATCTCHVPFTKHDNECSFTYCTTINSHMFINLPGAASSPCHVRWKLNHLVKHILRNFMWVPLQRNMTGISWSGVVSVKSVNNGPSRESHSLH